MKVKTHKILIVGTFIYAFALAFGVCVEAQQTAGANSTIQEKATLLSVDATNGPVNGNQSTRGINSRMLIEDDDDCAKDLLAEVHFCKEVYVDMPTWLNESYNPYHKEITTPPPRA